MPRTDSYTCKTCGASLLRPDALHVVHDAEGALWLDVKGTLEQENSFWLCDAPPCARPHGEELVARIRAVKTKQFAQAMALARKSGQAVLGLDTILEKLFKGRNLRLCLLATDAGKSTVRQLENYGETLDVYRLLDKDALSEAVGVRQCSVIAFTPNARAVKAALTRLLPWASQQRIGEKHDG